jgi:AbrB family looped-hinge helix DNA binding protein
MIMAIPRIVQIDKRGQIVIPKEVREELGINPKTDFWVYSIGDEGILLKKE